MEPSDDPATPAPDPVLRPLPRSTYERPRLPMLMRYPLLAGAAAGLLLRLAFSGPGGSPWSAMAGWFVVLAPIVTGMVTVYLAEREAQRSWGYYIVAPMMATALFVLGSLLLLIEGLICAVVIVPMFALLGAVGGLLMGTICRATRWPRHSVYGVAVLPFLFAMAGSWFPEPTAHGRVERSVLIAAPRDVVWESINYLPDIRHDEMADAFAARIGVPMPLSGHTESRPEGRVRVSQWGKQVHFEEVLQEWQPHASLRWSYRFLPDSFPRGALDDHVVIGGHYFDLIDTRFTLSDESGRTRLTTVTRYRITTHFNLYAGWVAQLLIGNLTAKGLEVYRDRSEAAALSGGDAT